MKKAKKTSRKKVIVRTPNINFCRASRTQKLSNKRSVELRADIKKTEQRIKYLENKINARKPLYVKEFDAGSEKRVKAILKNVYGGGNAEPVIDKLSSVYVLTTDESRQVREQSIGNSGLDMISESVFSVVDAFDNCFNSFLSQKDVSVYEDDFSHLISIKIFLKELSDSALLLTAERKKTLTNQFTKTNKRVKLI